LFGVLFGWSEPVLRLALALPTLAAVLGTYCLGRRWCTRPVLAALATLLMPVFLLCSTSVLGDILMLAFWIWAIYLWDRGICDRQSPFLALAGVLMALAVLCAYNGVLLIPLLLVHALAVRRKPGWWLLALLLPGLVLGIYESMTYEIYGRSVLLDLLDTALEQPAVPRRGFIPTLMTGLAFAGGCVAEVLFFAPLLYRGRVLLWALVAGTLLVFISPLLGDFGPHELYSRRVVRWALIVQGVVFSGAGVGLFLIAGTDFARRRDPQGLLLLLWVLATVVFGTFMTGAILGRSFLPLSPAAALLIVRRLEQRFGPNQGRAGWRLYGPLVPAGLLSLLVVWADYGWAGSAQEAASEIGAQYMDRKQKVNSKRTLWFQGHWGFHYYMEAAGGRPMDYRSLQLHRGDILAIPFNNYSQRVPPPEILRPRALLRPSTCSWLTTMNRWSGAGYYGDGHGPLPFALGEADPEIYFVCEFIPLDRRVMERILRSRPSRARNVRSSPTQEKSR
jgi:hypothetical protein